jgi:hypothetical protein
VTFPPVLASAVCGGHNERTAMVAETMKRAWKNTSNADLIRSMKTSFAVEPSKPDQRRLVKILDAVEL